MTVLKILKKLKTYIICVTGSSNNTLAKMFFIAIPVMLFVRAIATRLGRRRRRRMARQYECALAEKLHVANVLATNELDIFASDSPCYDNLAHARATMCHMLTETNKINTLTFKEFYMTHVYNKDNFPLTYRSPETVSMNNVNERVILKFYNKHCYDSGATVVATIIMIIILLATISICAIASKSKSKIKSR